jgi:hypothetical protein
MDIPYYVPEERLARICWNRHGWVTPSGPVNKSKSGKSYEAKYGFGHEEWLFGTNNAEDGFHYGFLEPIRKYYDKYIGRKFNLTLYTYDRANGQYNWVGKLNNVEVITPEMAENVLKEYKARGWVDKMILDLNEYGINRKIFNTYKHASDILNIRFKPSELENIFEYPIPIDPGVIPGNRYTLYNFNDRIKFPKEQEGATGFDFESGTNVVKGYKKKGKKKSTSTEAKEIELEHNEMIEAFLEYLQKEYPNQKSKMECKAYGQSRVDVVRETPRGYIFYEIKTYINPRVSIRHALGQLFEYALYPDANNAIELFIVTPKPTNENIKSYIKKLNTMFKIPLSYIHFDYRKKKIIEEVK